MRKYHFLWITSDYTCSLCLSPLQALPRTENLGIPFLHFHHPNHQKKLSGVRGRRPFHHCSSSAICTCRRTEPTERVPGNLNYTGNGDRQQNFMQPGPCTVYLRPLAEVFCNRTLSQSPWFYGNHFPHEPNRAKSSQIESNRVKSSQIESNRVKSSQFQSKKKSSQIESPE